MKTCPKILLSALSLALLASSLQAAKKRGREGDNEQQPRAPQAARVSTDTFTTMAEVAQAALTTAFPILVTHAGPSTPPAITADQLQALRGAAGTLKIIMDSFASRRATRSLDPILQSFDTLADNCITAIESVVLDTRAALTELAAAIDGYNDARGRTTRADGEPIPRLRDAAIAHEHRQSKKICTPHETFDPLADNCISTIESVVFGTREELTELADAIDDYNDARGRTTRADGEPVPRLHDAAIAHEHVQLKKKTTAHEKIFKMKSNVYLKRIGEFLTPTDRKNFFSSFAEEKHPSEDYDIDVIMRHMCDTGTATPEQIKTIATAIHATEKRGLQVADHDGKYRLYINNIDCNIDCNLFIPDNPNEALLEAARRNNLEFTQLSLALGADVNAPDKRYRNTALTYAAFNGYTEIVQALLDHPGVNVNAVDTFDGGTPLIGAARFGHTETVQALLAHPGVNVNAVDLYGFTALTTSVCSHDSRPETIKALLTHPGIDVNALQFGETALMIAARCGRTETVQTLLDLGADVNAVDRFGKTALMMAAEEGHTETVQALVNHPTIQLRLCDGSIE